MKFNKEKTKKFQKGGKTSKEIMEEARRNQALEREAQRVDRAMQPSIDRELAVMRANPVATANITTTSRYLNTPTVNVPQISNRFNTDIKPSNQTFGQAFAAARKAGLKEFDWLDPKTGKLRKIAVKLKNEPTNTNTANTSTVSNTTVNAPLSEEQLRRNAIIREHGTEGLKISNTTYDEGALPELIVTASAATQPSSSWWERFNENNAKRREIARNRPSRGVSPLLQKVGYGANKLSMRYQQGGILKAQQGSLVQRYKEMTDSLNGVVNNDVINSNEFDYSKLSPEFAGPLPPDRESGYRKYLPPYLQGRALDAIKNKVSDFLMPNRHQVNPTTYTTYKEKTPFIGTPKEVRSIVGPNGQTSTMVIRRPNTSKADTTFIPPGYVKDPDLYPKFTPQDIREGNTKGRGNGSYLNKFSSPQYFPHIGKHQQGGKLTQEDLIMDFAFRYLTALGVNVEQGIPEEHISQLTEVVNNIDTPEFWTAYEEDPDAIMQEYLTTRQEDIEYAKKGMKLKKLRNK